MAVALDPTCIKWLHETCTQEMLEGIHDITSKLLRNRTVASIPPTVMKPQSEVITKAKRPLNSWIAFRCYYSNIFKGLEQKVISGFVKKLWSSDPYKAKWSILSKAWSVIRDTVGKDKAPLDVFLHMAVPFINVPRLEVYLEALGWNLSLVGPNPELLRFSPNNRSNIPTTTTTSVDDILTFCRENGYSNMGSTRQAEGESLIMSVQTPPTPVEIHISSFCDDVAHPQTKSQAEPVAPELRSFLNTGKSGQQKYPITGPHQWSNENRIVPNLPVFPHAGQERAAGASMEAVFDAVLGYGSAHVNSINNTAPFYIDPQDAAMSDFVTAGTKRIWDTRAEFPYHGFFHPDVNLNVGITTFHSDLQGDAFAPMNVDGRDEIWMQPPAFE